MGTTSAGALGTPDLPRFGIDMNNQSATGVPRPKLATAEFIAKVAHEVNRAWCQYNGDDSQLPWNEAPDWQRQSVLNGVLFHALNPNAGNDASHNNWMEQKIAEGWVYGKVKDPNASPPTHPCLLAFEELPRDQQFKDELFRTICRAALD